MISPPSRAQISMLLILASGWGCRETTRVEESPAEAVDTVEAPQTAEPLPFGADPRTAQIEMLAAAEGLLPPGTSQMSLAEAHSIEKSLRDQLADAKGKDTIYLALALLYEFHSPDEAFPAEDDAAHQGVLDDGRSLARVSAAISVLSDAVEANPANLAALWQLALLRENLDDRLAVETWQALVRHAPEHLQALTRLGEGQILLEQHEESIATGQRALTLALHRNNEEEAGRARNILGRAFLHQQRYEEAEEMFKNAAVRTDGSHWGCAYQSLGQLYATLGEADLPTMEVSDPRRAMSAALDAYQQDDYSAALSHIEGALSTSKEGELKVMRAFLLMFLERDEEAREAFKRAARAQPEAPGPGVGLAHLEIFAGRAPEAATLLQPALRSWHGTKVSETAFPRYYAFIHRLACMANGRIRQHQAGSKHSEGGQDDGELARVVCAMSLGFTDGPDSPEPDWVRKRDVEETITQ